MKTFDEIWEFTDTIPGSFLRSSGEQLFKYASEVPLGGLIVEVGVDQGRSASLLLEAAQGRNVAVYLVDSWESVLIDNLAKVQRMADTFNDCWFGIINKFSVDAAREFGDDSIDLIHIDANHHFPHPQNDCEAWMRRVKSGGIACFHDVHPSWPAVVEAVSKYTAGWEDLGNFESLAIRRKP